MDITSVKNTTDGYTVNSQFFIPNDDPENEDYQDILQWVSDGGVIESEFTEDELLQNARDKKKEELSAFHNSKEVRTLKINNTYEIYLHGDYRDLVSEQLRDIELQIKKGLASEDDAKFDYYYNGDDSYVPVTYSQLEDISIKMMEIVNSNFKTYKGHVKSINDLATIEDVEGSEDDDNDEGYDYKEGYLLNQNIDLL